MFYLACVGIVSGYKENAWYNLSCLCGYKRTVIWAVTKSCQLADSSPRSMAQPVMPAVGGKMYTDACSVFTAITGPLLSPC